MGLLVLLGLVTGVGVLAFKKGEKVAVEKEIQQAAKQPVRISMDAFDHLLGLFAGGERTDLKKSHPQAVNMAKGIIAEVIAKGSRGVFPSISWEQLSKLYDFARLPGPMLDKGLGTGSSRDVTEPLEMIFRITTGVSDGIAMKKMSPEERQAMKVIGTTVNTRWANKVSPPITKAMLKQAYQIALAIRKRL